MTDIMRNGSYENPSRLDQRSKFTYYECYVVIALLLITNSLNPVFGGLFGKSESYTDSNPLKLLFSVLIYCGAAAYLKEYVKTTREILWKNKILFILILLPMVSVIWSVDPSTTVKRSMAHALTLILCIFLAASLRPTQLLNRLFTVFFISGSLSLIYILLFPSMGIDHSPGNNGAWNGLYGQKNEMGRICSIAIFVGMFQFSKGRVSRAYLFLYFLLFGMLLIGSQSRTNWLIVFAGILLIPLFRFLGSKQASPFVRVGSLILFVTLAAASLAAVYQFVLQDLGRDETFSGRTTLWEYVNSVAEESFPVMGSGYGAFFTPNGALPLLNVYLSHWATVPTHAHNGFIQAKAEMGYAGEILLYVFVVLTFWRAIAAQIRVRRIDSTVWILFACYFVFNNLAKTVSFVHSDISWVLMVLTYIYTEKSYSARLLTLGMGETNLQK